ncbi:MAG: gephyrin-like molybdotransferase Glp [Chloroflexota bacterium]
MSNLTPVTKAVNYILGYFTALDMQYVNLREAARRTLANPIYSELSLPPFDASSVDGFAIRSADVKTASVNSPITLDVVADIPAGDSKWHSLEPGEAIRIMTGAMMPAGADAVVMVENTDYGERLAGTPLPKQVKVMQKIIPGANIRPKGQDINVGDEVFASCQNIRPQDLGMLAMLGVAEVPVIRRPRIGVITPGDELITPGDPLDPGKVYESNSHMLKALIKDCGAESLDFGIVADNPEYIKAYLDKSIANGIDLFITTGGISVGAYDFIRALLETEGELRLWRVNMRPGKPLVFGHYRDVPFIGLPGNPVSAYVSFQIFVKPILRKMLMKSPIQRVVRKVQLLDPIHSDGRESYLRANAKSNNSAWTAHLTGHQGSGNLHSLVQANTLLIIPAGVTYLPEGSKVDAWFFAEEQDTRYGGTDL